MGGSQHGFGDRLVTSGRGIARLERFLHPDPPSGPLKLFGEVALEAAEHHHRDE